MIDFLKTLKKRSALEDRLAQALAHLSIREQVGIISHFISLDELQKIVELFTNPNLNYHWKALYKFACENSNLTLDELYDKDIEEMRGAGSPISDQVGY